MAKMKIIYDAQELYDEETLQAKIKAQAQQDDKVTQLAAEIETKITTFNAIAQQYKAAVTEGNEINKPILLLGLLNICLDLAPDMKHLIDVMDKRHLAHT